MSTVLIEETRNPV